MGWPDLNPQSDDGMGGGKYDMMKIIINFCSIISSLHLDISGYCDYSLARLRGGGIRCESKALYPSNTGARASTTLCNDCSVNASNAHFVYLTWAEHRTTTRQTRGISRS